LAAENPTDFYQKLFPFEINRINLNFLHLLNLKIIKTMNLLIKILITSGLVLLITNFMPGSSCLGFTTALVAIVLGLIFIKNIGNTNCQLPLLH
jgi:hypothetical protein